MSYDGLVFHLSYIYRTSDNLYQIYSEGTCQYSKESARTSIELTRPFTVNQIQNVTCSVNDLQNDPMECLHMLEALYMALKV